MNCDQRTNKQSTFDITPSAYDMATIGGGSFFGKVGTFEKGYEFDAMILDDSNIRHPQEISTRDRLERLVYLSDDRNLVGKYVQGRKVI